MPKLVILQSRKKLQVLKIFLKKSFQLISADKSYKTVSGFFFFFLMGLAILNFRWFFGSEKLFFTIKLLIKLDGKKYQENSAHRFGYNDLTNHLISAT